MTHQQLLAIAKEKVGEQRLGTLKYKNDSAGGLQATPTGYALI